MVENLIPYRTLLDEIILGATSISHQLPLISSILSWMDDCHKREATPRGWMLLMDGNWTKRPRLSVLFDLDQSVSQIGVPLADIMRNIEEYNSYKGIKKALSEMYVSYTKLPNIKAELSLISLGENLFEKQTSLSNIIEYVQKVKELKELSTKLKHTLFETLLTGLEG